MRNDIVSMWYRQGEWEWDTHSLKEIILKKSFKIYKVNRQNCLISNNLVSKRS